ncbi:30S ribosomal protein S8 [Paremcibacter congregatus]|jgi:small subunit ribosomal protein S8|uniref:Small ribosomal subunit protein uS8 n=1 Tax=Paremcibacter congregatus TaxID=2043170 RepID=A0A2G4YMI5_9PROT|nr:30S ribosomal protein S8 [Paremcibacter congregatus]PHZ83532.1 30S ribosomal protein S8 [Paremcibacter congregatus]QDE28382.1 30S ribosomal protein S8 [Paremcibacter congregatus]|tara:strand:+ start:5719 stop:6117 length:399 start_codon:yes stop_codon:yes gene_type:complete
MSMSDPLADMITRIRNGQRVNKSSVSSPASNMRQRVLDVLEREGFIRGYNRADDQTGKPQINIELKYHEGQPVIREIKRVSKPGLRVYSSVADLPRVRNGLGISIVSTPKGVLSDSEARDQNVGGEIICTVF